MDAGFLKIMILAIVPVFVAVDALGMVPVFLSLTSGMPNAQRDRLLWTSTFTALVVAVLFLLAGRLLFILLGITMSDFMVAGGIILFIIAIREIFSLGMAIQAPERTAGVIPLAVPLIAGPAVLTTSLVLLNTLGFYPTLASLILNILFCGIVLHFSRFFLRLLGQTGSHILSKIFNLLLAAIGVMLIRRGIQEILTAWLGS